MTFTSPFTTEWPGDLEQLNKRVIFSGKLILFGSQAIFSNELYLAQPFSKDSSGLVSYIASHLRGHLRLGSLLQPIHLSLVPLVSSSSSSVTDIYTEYESWLNCFCF